MGYTKRQIVEKAFAKLGLASYIYDVQSDAYQDAMEDLDAMLAEWNGRGIRLGYPIPSTPEGGDLDAEASIPDRAWLAAYTNLALLIAPDFGKEPTRSLKNAAKKSLETLQLQRPPTMQYRKVPLGAGNKPWRTGYGEFTKQEDPLDVGNDSELEI